MSAFAFDRLPRATAWRFAFLLVQGGMSLLLFSVLAHVLPASEFAPTAIAQGVLVIAQAVSDFGLSQAAVIALPSLLAARPQDARDLKRGASSIFMVGAVGAFVLALLAVAVVSPVARLPVALIAPASAMAVLVAGSDGMLRAVGEFRRPVILVSLSRAGAFLGVLAATSGSASLTCAGISLGTVLASLPATLLLLRRYREGTRADSRELIRTALPLGFGDLFMVAGGRMNTILLSAISGIAAGAGFESTWRLYQLSQYVAGGLATGAAPFMAHALGAGRHRDLARILRWVGAVTVLSGLVLGLGTYLVRSQISEFLFGSRLGHQVAGAIGPLAALTPLSFAGFLAVIALAASARDRWAIVAASALGAAVNLFLVILLAPAHGLQGATLACAIGLGVTQIGLLLQLGRLMRRLGRDAVMGALESSPSW